MTVEQIGVSALGRPLYGVVFNAMDTPQQIQDYNRWVKYRGIALEDPARAQALLEEWGDDVKVPVFVQGAIHGNEYEGVESNMQLIKELATTPYGANPKFDDILNHVDPGLQRDPEPRRPRRRHAGERQRLRPEPRLPDAVAVGDEAPSVALMQEWLPVEVLDLHGYVTPTLIEATTKPHNPSIEYDLWLKWNQDRDRLNEAAMHAVGLNVTRPINHWCADGTIPLQPVKAASATTARCPARRSPRAGTTGARSTRRCTHSTSGSTAPRSRCATRRAPAAACPARPRTPAGGWAPTRPSTSSRRRRSSTCRQPERDALRRGGALSPRRRGRAPRPTAAVRLSTWTTTG